MVNNRQRCGWVPENDAQYLQYHDVEWGVPLHDDLKLFEMLILEGQIGSSTHFSSYLEDFIMKSLAVSKSIEQFISTIRSKSYPESSLMIFTVSSYQQLQILL